MLGTVGESLQYPNNTTVNNKNTKCNIKIANENDSQQMKHFAIIQQTKAVTLQPLTSFH